MNDAPNWVKRRRTTVLEPGTGGRNRYPFATMDVRTMFTVPRNEQTCSWRSFQVMASQRGKELGRLFYVRKNIDGAFECWRES